MKRSRGSEPVARRRMKPPGCMPTMIGSLPHTDPDEAVRLVLDNLDEAPMWPELPRHSFLEELPFSLSDGLPCLVVDEAARKMYIDTGGDCAAELSAFYEKALLAEQGGELAGYARTGAYASALEPTARALEAKATRFPCVKVHCLGPVSFQLQLTDAEGKSLYYNETFQDVLTRQVCLQSRWMVRRFAPYAETVLAFLDEPSLAAFGSSGYLGVLREDVVKRLGRSPDKGDAVVMCWSKGNATMLGQIIPRDQRVGVGGRMPKTVTSKDKGRMKRRKL